LGFQKVDESIFAIEEFEIVFNEKDHVDVSGVNFWLEVGKKLQARIVIIAKNKR